MANERLVLTGLPFDLWATTISAHQETLPVALLVTANTVPVEVVIAMGHHLRREPFGLLQFCEGTDRFLQA